MKHSRLSIALAAALALPQAIPVLAADTTAPPAARAQTQAPVTRGYLGVTIDRLPEPVRAQLPEAIPREQGLLVEQVMQDSPAARAGLQPFDILLQYNDQKLYSPEQLTRLVGSDTGEQPVKLTVVRGGKVSTLDVTLGETPRSQALNRLSRIEPHRLSAMPRHPSVGSTRQGRGDNDKVWESFDSLSLDKTGDDQYKAVIGYLADDGTHQRLEFQGSRDEIRRKILAQKNLPATERDQLLDALAARDEVFPFDARVFGALEHELLAAPSLWGWNPYF